MKNVLQNLLIVFSLGLCLLLAFQWHREGVLRRELQQSDKTAQGVGETLESLRSDVSRLEAEIARVDTLRKQLSSNATAGEAEVVRLTEELHEADQLAAQVESLKTALEKANATIKSQDEALQRLGEERNELAERYNELAEEYNDLVNRWNTQQAGLTNTTTIPR